MSGSRRNRLEDVGALYSRSLSEHGSTPQGVGWQDEATHRLRFDQLAHILSALEDRLTVNDLGCGYGALHEYLLEQGISLALYRGYEISRPMLEAARQRLPAEGVELIEGGRLSRNADYSFASGIFNVRLSSGVGEWQEYVLQTLSDMNRFSRRGFAFNMLSTYVDFREEHLFYGDPLFFFDHCKRNYSRYVTLVHDYPLWEWTLLVRKR